MERILRWGLRGGFEELHSLERVHSEGNVHARAVGEEGSQGGLLEQSEDQDLVPETHMGRVKIQENQKKMAKNSWSVALTPHSLHALLEDRVPPGLTDDQIGPLDDDDADKERRVARELHNLPLLVCLGDRTEETVQSTSWRSEGRPRAPPRYRPTAGHSYPPGR